MCHASTAHFVLLAVVGVAFCAGGLWSIARGQVYYRRLIVRSEEPLEFWVTALSLLVFGAMSLLGVTVCP